jgi:regulator of ribosome biosynthesis
LREAKKARVDKNIESRMKNEERAGNLAKGATNRVMKAREKDYKAGKEAGRKDQQMPIGVPVDLKDSTGEVKLRGKTSTMAALSAVQRSTASLGKFDKMREGEPERKKTLTKMKKRKYESATDKKVLSTEGEKSMKILDAVMNGGGAAKDKEIRKGKLAKGETAYDYDYNDGLGASTFKKKKVSDNCFLVSAVAVIACINRQSSHILFCSTHSGPRWCWKDEKDDEEKSQVDL